MAIKLLVLATLGLTGVVVGIALYLGWSWGVAGQILPGVVVLQTPLSGLNDVEAAAALDHRWQREVVELRGPNQTLMASPKEIGLVLHTQATVAQATALSQEPNFDRLVAFYRLYQEIRPLVSIDDRTATAYLKAVSNQLTIPPVNAGIAWDGNRVVETPAVAGETIDIPATVATWRAYAVAYRSDVALPLITRPLPPQIATTAPQIDLINQRLAAPLELGLFDPLSGQETVTAIPAAMWVSWLKIQPAAAGDPAAWSVDSDAVSAALPQLASQSGLQPFQTLDSAAVEEITALVIAHLAASGVERPHIRITHGERLYTVQAGDTLASIARAHGFPYPWLQEANPGVDALAVGQQLVIPSPDLLLPLPVVFNKRIVISLSEQRMWAFETGSVKWDWSISTGIASSPTSPGVFQIQTHEETAYAGNWDLHMPYFMGIYQPLPHSDFMNGFHGFPTRDGSQLLWTNSIGRPVTYGCILVDNAVVKELYQWAEAGVIVEIRE